MSVAGPIPPGWQRYEDERAGYALCYPPEFTPERRSSNAIILTSPQGVALRLTIGRSDGGEDPKIALARQKLTLAEGGAAIDNEETGSDWFALSGFRNAQGFYTRSTNRDGRAVNMTLEYPLRLARRWRQVAGTISNCLEIQPLPER